MYFDIYQMTSEETRFYLDANHTRFQELLNMGMESPIQLSVQRSDAGFLSLTSKESVRFTVQACGLLKGQEALFPPDWVGNRIRFVMSVMRSEGAIMQMFPSKIVSQMLYLQSASQFSPLVQLLKKLQKNVGQDPKEYERFAAIIREYERHIPQAGDMDEDDDFDDDDFKAIVYKPNHILPLEKLRLSPIIRAEIKWFCKKYRHRKALIAEGLPWGNRLLLAGPPGNGKTALAGALSTLLGLPIFIVNMGELRRSHIGETGHQMSILFQGLKHSSLIEAGKAIIFFDECDSVATTRIYEQGADKEDSASLNVLITSLDQLDFETIVITATNNPEELDPAFKRRFSSYLWLAPPSPKEIQGYVADYERGHKISLTQKERAQIDSLYGKPWAKVTEFCQSIHMARIILIVLSAAYGLAGKEDGAMRDRVPWESVAGHENLFREKTESRSERIKTYQDIQNRNSRNFIGIMQKISFFRLGIMQKYGMKKMGIMQM